MRNSVQTPAFLVLLVIVGIAVVFIRPLAYFWRPESVGEAYYIRRHMDKYLGIIFPYIVFPLAIAVTPILFKYTFMASSHVGIAGFLAVGAGTIGGLFGYYQRFRNVAPSLANRVFLPIGAALFLLGVMLLGYYFGMALIDVRIVNSEYVAGHFKWPKVDPWTDTALTGISAVLWALVFVAAASAWFVNTNQISLNRYYRDRLMEAYMPHPNLKDETSPADSLFLFELAKPNSPPPPYPLINANVVLSNDDNSTFRVRGGDNFLLSPFFCGSNATLWSATDEKYWDVTLPSAMTASGAAVNPFSGYVGTGPTRGRFVSIVMALFNLRLGYWIRNPNYEVLGRRTEKSNAARSGSIKRPKRCPNHIYPGLYYTLLGLGYRHDSAFLELTDGGHFDNLGIYELVHRQCKLIIVCDGEADRETSYSALVSVQRRIEDDFGARIVFENGQGPELLVEKYPMKYPSNAKKADQPFFVATVEYEGEEDGEPQEGKIIYMKATMIEDVSLQVKGYKGAHPDFPNETTADQFFDPAQFEAYRELGYRTCTRMMNTLNLDEWVMADESKIERLASTPDAIANTLLDYVKEIPSQAQKLSRDMQSAAEQINETGLRKRWADALADLILDVRTEDPNAGLVLLNVIRAVAESRDELSLWDAWGKAIIGLIWDLDQNNQKKLIDDVKAVAALRRNNGHNAAQNVLDTLNLAFRRLGHPSQS